MTTPIPWTFGHGGDLTWSPAWLTDALVSEDRSEQRRKLRSAPRHVLRWQALNEGRERRLMETRLRQRGAALWDVPLPMFTELLATAAAAGAGALSVPTDSEAFVAGGRALLITGDRSAYETVTIATATGGSLTLSGVTTLDWPAGTEVLPLRYGRFTGVPTTSRFTGDAAPLEPEFQLTEVLELTADLGTATYRGYPVFERLPDWSTDPAYTADRELALVDESTGPVEAFDFPGTALPSLPFTFTLDGRADVLAYLRFLFGLAGRYQAVWVPTLAQDLLVVANIAAAAVTVDVEASGLADAALGLIGQDIRLELRDGTVFYRRLTAAVAVDADTERVTLDSALGVDVAAADVAIVSYLWLGRLDADTVSLKYFGYQAATSSLSFKAFKHDV